MSSHLTAIHRKKPSSSCQFLFKKGLIIGPVLDYGCGHGKDVDFLREQGIPSWGWDPYWRPIGDASSPFPKYKTILCTYVLNVIKKEKTEGIIEDIHYRLATDGTAYFTVRRDLTQDQTTPKGYQRSVILGLDIVYEKKGAFCIYKMKKQ